MIISDRELRNSLTLRYLEEAETRILQHFREDAFNLTTDRTNCTFVRSTVQWVRNQLSWKELPWSQRARVRILMSLISRSSTFGAMMHRLHKTADLFALSKGDKMPVAYFDLQLVKKAIEQEAYREYGMKLCGNLRHYFKGKEGLLDLMFWTQLNDLEQTAYENNVAPKLYREAFTLRYLRLVEIAKAQLTMDSDVTLKSHSNQI